MKRHFFVLITLVLLASMFWLPAAAVQMNQPLLPPLLRSSNQPRLLLKSPRQPRRRRLHKLLPKPPATRPRSAQALKAPHRSV